LNDITTILPTARSIRAELLGIELQTLFLPNLITMHEFISKLCIVKDFKTIDTDARTLLLMRAADFKEFSKLQIERNFFTFTKNSSYIFKFFEELSAEKYDISNLSCADIYAEFEEHIEILQELYNRYETLCSEKKIIDPIFLPKLYTFNSHFASSHKKVRLVLSGHLTNFELELLSKCCEYTQVEIVFNTSNFNKKMQDKFKELGFECIENYKYTISLNDKKIIQEEKIEQNKNIICQSFSEPILQIAFIKKMVYNFLQKGYDANKIAIILPDEKTAELLKLFDKRKNFNFAMGESYKNSSIYKKIDASLKLIDQSTKENLARVKRVDNDIYSELVSISYKQSNEIDFVELLEKFKEHIADKNEKKIFNEEIYSFKYILPTLKDMSVKSALNLFLQRLAQRTIDDVRGGKITVMGVLETRGVEFDAIVIVDFNDSNVPKKSDKDMFLNSNVREFANLPTINDRENLQKHYYYQLINSSKEVAISYVKSAESQPSRFLKQLGIKEKNIYDEDLYSTLLFNSLDIKENKFDKEIVLEYTFKDKKLSATKIKTFLTCRRKYYYKYIVHLNGHTIPKDIPQEHEIGTSVHEALKNLYIKKNNYVDANELKHDLYEELDVQTEENELDRYLMAIQKKRMEKFIDLEIDRFKKGINVYQCEQTYECQYSGITLTGQIDRIDKKENLVYVLDYKTGSYPLYNKNNFPDATDFQLEFYYLLAQGLGNVEEVAYYDLKESKIVEELFLEEKLEVLKSHIKDMLNMEEIEFSKCEDVKSCMFCDYKIVCGRD
jgi:RecB family exonuclease